ncbi:HpcH/HpaI aldolase/citrate lyase family protein [Pricia sp.]|uniref:HpcH/HpaI aldolase family protein n=1 Tax=Pricia sp. TaxID=2268138 RepID=UPI003593DBFC
MKGLKKRVQNGEALNGCWLNLGSPLTAEIVGQSGFDWVLIDLEHGAGSEKDALSQVQALQASATGVIIRVESNDKRRIQRALDMGAEGIMCPQAETAADAKIAVDGMFYFPDGRRGVAKMVRATGFGKDFDTYRQDSKDNILGIIQIETTEALDHLDEIAALDGVDVLFVGPSDLTMSLGIFGQLDHPRYLDALKAIVAAATKAGKATGILLFDPADYKTYYDMGIRFIACGSDATFVAQGAKQMAKALNSKRS